MNNQDRAIARIAARNVYLHGAPHSPSKPDMTLDERLLEEAKNTDRYKCDDAEMLKILNAEYRRVKGQRMGGIMSAIRRTRE